MYRNFAVNLVHFFQTYKIEVLWKKFHVFIKNMFSTVMCSSHFSYIPLEIQPDVAVKASD